MIDRFKDLLGISPKTSESLSGRLVTAQENQQRRPQTGPQAPTASSAAASSDSIFPSENVPARRGPDFAMADAFTALLAAELGEAPLATADPATHQLPDSEIDRIAERVIQRLTNGGVGEDITRIVTDVSERLVREEIQRIRAAAQTRPA